jgi:hypothetical protein
MKTDTVVYEGRTAIVRSRNRKTAITEAQYMQVLRDKYPEILAYEIAMLQVTMPPVKTKEDDPEMMQYVTATAAARSRNQIGAELSVSANNFVPILARFTSVMGAPFIIEVGGRVPPEQVSIAFNDFLEEDEGQDETGKLLGFWPEAIRRINALDAPITSVVERPPETLTEAEQVDPLLSAPVVSGNLL